MCHALVRVAVTGFCILSFSAAQAADPPIVVNGLDSVNFDLPDGGLRPVTGVHNFQVFRATRDAADIADTDGWTYSHHQDLAVWKGRMYAAWAMTPVDEDVPPYKVLYSTSTDGIHWPAPQDLFPREVAWACRFYFFHAKNDRMLAFCAAAVDKGTVSEAKKTTLLVREISAEHTLGPVFTLVGAYQGSPPLFDQTKDAGFLEACREALANNMLLEQADYGRFLGDRRIKWHDANLEFNGWKFGKAFCFFHRADGAAVGISKMGFTTISSDNGVTWSEPVLPPTLIAGGSKVWGQRTADGRFALSFNPDRKRRYPLIVLHGDDGINFSDPRVIHGELPRQRYAGKYKDIGAQYMRGLAEWSNDGTFADKQALWMIYSVHKEDIWVSRIPLPLQPKETPCSLDDFGKAATGGMVPGWNLYRPRWSPVEVVKDGDANCLKLSDGDPADYARAIRTFPPAARVDIELRLKAAQADARLEVDLCDATGRRAVRIALAENGHIEAMDGTNAVDMGKYPVGGWFNVTLATCFDEKTCKVSIEGGTEKSLAVSDAEAGSVERLSIRTGVWRGCGETLAGDPPPDKPLEHPGVFCVEHVRVAQGSHP